MTLFERPFMKGKLLMGILTPLFCLLLIFLRNPPTDETNPDPEQKIERPQEEKPKPGARVSWFEHKVQKDLHEEAWGEYLKDIENHLHPSLGTHYRDKDKITWAHETTHGIHGWLNNEYQEPGDRSHYHFYVGNDKAARVKQPNITIADVAKIVPNSLKKSRFELYLVQQRRDWNDEPLYIWDEWVAYCNGAQCGLELVKKKLYEPNKSDIVWGTLEFNVYAIYVAIAQQKYDPDYDNTQLLEFLAWNLERSMKIYNECQNINAFAWDDTYIRHLRTNADAAELRNFTIKTWGKKWANDVFGF